MLAIITSFQSLSHIHQSETRQVTGLRIILTSHLVTVAVYKCMHVNDTAS